MTSRLRGAALLIAVLAVPLAFDAALRAVDFGLALRVWTVAAGAVLAAALVGAAGDRYERAPVARLFARRRRLEEDERPPSLAEVERALEFSTWSAGEVDRRLRPLLREVARHRLRTRHGLDLDADQAAVQSRLGPQLYALTRPAPAHSPLREPGLPVATLRAAVEALEEL